MRIINWQTKCQFGHFLWIAAILGPCMEPHHNSELVYVCSLCDNDNSPTNTEHEYCSYFPVHLHSFRMSSEPKNRNVFFCFFAISMDFLMFALLWWFNVRVTLNFKTFGLIKFQISLLCIKIYTVIDAYAMWTSTPKTRSFQVIHVFNRFMIG